MLDGCDLLLDADSSILSLDRFLACELGRVALR